MAKKQSLPLDIDIFRHDEATRKNIPTAEHQSVMDRQEQSPVRVAYERRNRDLDPQLVWRGKDEQDWSDLVVSAPPLYIQEKVHPKVLIDDLLRRSRAEAKAADTQFDLFADFNGLPDDNAKTEFYRHDAHWANRMILGDSLQVMASLAEREGLRGKVQCFYFDPPYGIKFNSNFQWSTTSRDVKDGNTDHITREPEQVKAFRDTWRDGIHSYLTYLRDRLTVARDLLTESGSIFVQIGDENVHRVRALMDEVFGDENCVSVITVAKTSSATSELLAGVADYILFYAKSKLQMKYRQPLREKSIIGDGASAYVFVEDMNGIRRRRSTDDESDNPKLKSYRLSDMRSSRPPGSFPVIINGKSFVPQRGYWKTGEMGFIRLDKSNRIECSGSTLNYVRYLSDYPAFPINNVWTDLSSSVGSDKVYVVQTSAKIIERCILMTTDPGDLVLDPTCGSGTTVFVAEQWGRRWITIDTSRVALALARARIMGARYSYYLLADSRDGQLKEAEITGSAPSTQPARGDIRHGFVYERVPHITLKSIANNSEIDVLWEQHQERLEPFRQKLNTALGKQWQEWEIPREAGEKWPDEATGLHAAWWERRIARQQEIDDSIAAKAEFEYLYDKPYIDRKKVRVAGPFTVESLSPHRVLGVDENDGLIDSLAETGSGYDDQQSFVSMILDNLRTSGVQQARKSDKIDFTSLTPWPGELVCAEGRYLDADGATERRAAIFIGPEFGTVSRPDLVGAAREAGDAAFDVLVTENMFGDILTDEASVLAGSMGLLPSASIGEQGPGVYEPIHGSAPDIAGKGIANPVGAILSAALLLRHSLRLAAEADAIERGVERAIADGFRTADIRGTHGTEEVTEAILKRITTA